MLWILKLCTFGVALVLAAGQTEPAADPRPTNVPSEPSGSMPAENSVDTPVSKIAAIELSQGVKKPKAPLSQGTDSWTPMGKTGGGGTPPWEPLTGQLNQDLPYDQTASQMTIGEQVMQRRQEQQQQQPQQYDIFGFPIDNNPDPFGGLFGGGGLFGSGSTQSADPFFGGLFGGSNQGGGLFGGSNSGHGPQGNMLQTMLLLQLLGGGDAPDPPAQGQGRGRGRPGRQITPPSPLEQLLRLEEIRLMRNMQRERVNRNRLHQQNRRPIDGSMDRPMRGPPGPPPERFRPGPGPRSQVYNNKQFRNFHGDASIPKPPPTQASSAGSYNQADSYQQSGPAGHPAVLDRLTNPTPAPTPSGQEPVERESQAGQGHASSQGQAQGHLTGQSAASASQQEVEGAGGSATGGGGSSQWSGRVQPTSYPAPGYSPRYPAHIQSSRGDPYNQGTQYQPFSGDLYNQRPRSRFGGPTFNQGPAAIPRNIQQLIRNPLFQRQLRTRGAQPGANPADIQADRADMMADYADNLQAMNPLQRLMQGLVPGLGGMSSMGGITSLGIGTGGGVTSPRAAPSPLDNLLGAMNLSG